MACVCVINFFSFMFHGAVVSSSSGLCMSGLGLLGWCWRGAVGGVLGSVLTRRIAAGREWGGPTSSAASCIPPRSCSSRCGGSPPPDPGHAVAAEFVAGFGVMILDISIGTIMAAVVPDPLRSRVSGAFMAMN